MHAAFLRGINLGRRRVTGEQLCAPLLELGFREVATYLASGNVAFATDDTTDLEARIEAALEAALGFPVDTFVRTAAEVADITRRRPFPEAVVAASTGTPQVTFLREAPGPAAIVAALAHATADDPLLVIGREWYWLPARGISGSALDVKAIEALLGRGTTRTLTTVTRFHAKLLSGPPADG